MKTHAAGPLFQGNPGLSPFWGILVTPGRRRGSALEEARVPLDSPPGSWDSFLSELASSVMPTQCLRVVGLQIAVPRMYSAHTSAVPGPWNPSHRG